MNSDRAMFLQNERFAQARQIGGLCLAIKICMQDKSRSSQVLSVCVCGHFIVYTVVTLFSICVSTGISKPQINMIIYY